jgi:hypothetical protein
VDKNGVIDKSPANPVACPESKMSDEDVVNAVRWRYRICNYLFRLGMAWFFLGAILGTLPRQSIATASLIELIGAGIFSAAVALSLAIYRCPVCDHFLSRFRPRKDQCPHCGAKVR